LYPKPFLDTEVEAAPTLFGLELVAVLDLEETVLAGAVVVVDFLVEVVVVFVLEDVLVVLLATVVIAFLEEVEVASLRGVLMPGLVVGTFLKELEVCSALMAVWVVA
jgi:hypothetical protein